MSDRGLYDIWRAIKDERQRQEQKHPGRTPASAALTDADKLVILAEEFGEAAREVYEKRPAQLRAELVQVAAVAVAWLESLDAAQKVQERYQPPLRYQGYGGFTERYAPAVAPPAQAQERCADVCAHCREPRPGCPCACCGPALQAMARARAEQAYTCPYCRLTFCVCLAAG